ncbi:MAG TPA: YceI family protein [Acidimicrobiales bacterium]|nr:YceI family protein [Acidimicrobiales bacterium]
MSTAETGATIAPADLTGNYTIDTAHTRIGFSARHAMVSKVRGGFNDFEGSAYIDAEKPGNSHVEVTIKVASIDTRNADRDAHLRTNDFLAIDEYPEIKFVSTEIEPLDDSHFKVTGDLTVRGITKPVTIDFEYTGAVQDPWGNTRIGFEGATTINRKDWGITWNFALEAGGVMVSEKVNLDFDVEAVKVKEEATTSA